MIKNLNQDTHQSNTDLLFSSFYDCISNTINTANGARTSEENFKYLRNKSWWSDETQALFDEKEKLKTKFIKSKADESRITIIKRQIEAIKTKWEKFGTKGTLTKINKNFNHEKTNFWKSLRKNLSTTVDVDLSTNDIKDQFQKLFNSKLLAHHDDNQLKSEIDEHLKLHKSDEKLHVDSAILLKNL